MRAVGDIITSSAEASGGIATVIQKKDNMFLFLQPLSNPLQKLSGKNAGNCLFISCRISATIISGRSL
jgi:hypothetical protein